MPVLFGRAAKRLIALQASEIWLVLEPGCMGFSLEWFVQNFGIWYPKYPRIISQPTFAVVPTFQEKSKFYFSLRLAELPQPLPNFVVLHQFLDASPRCWVQQAECLLREPIHYEGSWQREAVEGWKGKENYSKNNTKLSRTSQWETQFSKIWIASYWCLMQYVCLFLPANPRKIYRQIWKSQICRRQGGAQAITEPCLFFQP